MLQIVNRKENVKGKNYCIKSKWTQLRSNFAWKCSLGLLLSDMVNSMNSEARLGLKLTSCVTLSELLALSGLSVLICNVQ